MKLLCEKDDYAILEHLYNGNQYFYVCAIAQDAYLRAISSGLQNIVCRLVKMENQIFGILSVHIKLADAFYNLNSCIINKKLGCNNVK